MKITSVLAQIMATEAKNISVYHTVLRYGIELKNKEINKKFWSVPSQDDAAPTMLHWRDGVGQMMMCSWFPTKHHAESQGPKVQAWFHQTREFSTQNHRIVLHKQLL